MKHIQNKNKLEILITIESQVKEKWYFFTHSIQDKILNIYILKYKQFIFC